jgi:hypothetical protein
MSVLAWHFVHQSRRTAIYVDGRPEYTGPVVEPGLVQRIDGAPVCCERGLHASLRAIDALAYAPGPIVCRVELDGEIAHQHDKCAAQVRRVLWCADATRTLHEFACECAESVLHLVLHEYSIAAALAIHVKRLWLDGEADDNDLATARAAAWAAAGDAAGAAAGEAARATAWAAARAAARAAAGDAAWEAAGEAARATAWAAARDAARAAQAARLEEMLLALEPWREEVGER